MLPEAAGVGERRPSDRAGIGDDVAASSETDDRPGDNIEDACADALGADIVGTFDGDVALADGANNT